MRPGHSSIRSPRPRGLEPDRSASVGCARRPRRATPRPRARPSGRPRTARRARGRRRADRRPRAPARSAARHASRSHGAQYAPSIPSSATGWMPTGVAERRHAARQRLDHRQPEPLGLRRHEHGVGGVDPVRHLGGRDAAHRQQRRVAGRLAARGRSASAAATGRAGTAGSGPSRVEPEPLARLARAGSAGSARGRCPTGSTATRRVVPAPRSSAAELARDGGGQRGERQDRAREAVRARVEEVVAVQRHDDRPEPRGDRRPRRQPEVGVHDVEARAARSAGAARARRAGSRGGRAGTRTARSRRRRAAAAPRPGRARTSRAPAARASGTCS